MAKAAAATLPHFDSPAASASRSALRVLTEPKGAAPGNARPQDEAVDKACREAAAEAQAGFDRIRAADRAEFDRRLAERERQHNAETAAVLTERLATGLAEIEQRLAAEISRALVRFVAGAVRERALGELGDTVAALLAGKGGASIRVAGPAALIDAFRERVAAAGASVAFVTEEGAPDLTVTFNETVIRTAVADWMSRLAAAVEETRNG